MTVRYHPQFAQKVVRFAGQYRAISPRLGAGFRMEVDEALARIQAGPTAAGHFLNTGSTIVKEVRRRISSRFRILCSTACMTICW